MTHKNHLTRLLLGGTFLLSTLFLRGEEGGKRTMTPADLAALESVADPHLSPDGRLIAYTYNAFDAKRSRRSGNVWIAESSGATPPRQLTSIASSSHPRWSPDGKVLALLSNRSTGDTQAAPRMQVFLLPMAAGEAVPLTSFPNPVTDFEWSPDGKKIACVVKSGPPRGKNASDVRHYVEPIYKFDVGGWFDDLRAHIWVVDAATGQTRQLTSGNTQEETEPRWSPDGTSIVFVSQDKNKYPGTGGSISVVPASGGTPVRISTQDGLAHSPRWSEKGDKIAYISTPNDWDDAKIWIASPAQPGSTLAVTNAVPNLDVVPVDLDWDPSGKSILFLGMQRGTQRIFRADLTAGSVTAITEGDNVVIAADIDSRNDRMAFVQADTAHVGDVFVSDLKGRNQRQISHANAGLYRDVELQTAERLRYPSGDLTVEEFLMKPVGWKPGVSYPMILCIHGGPGGMWASRFYHDFQLFAAHGWAVLYVNPRGSSGYGEKFQRAVQKQWGGKAYDDLMRGVDFALDKYPWIDRRRLGVSGASFGGFMTNWIVGHTGRFAAAVTISSISNFTSLEGTRDMAYSHAKDFGGDLFQNFDFYVSQSPLKYASQVKTPTLVMHGDSDGRVPIEQGEQWFRALRHFNVPSEFVVFPRENHTYAADPKHRVELVGSKLAIVTHKPQTTRNRVQGFLNLPPKKGRPAAQVILIDTPGIHRPETRLNEKMMREVYEALEGSDLILMITDVSQKSDAGDRYVLDLIKKTKTPVFLILNKVDKIEKPKLLPEIERWSQLHDFKETIPISALKKDGLDDLLLAIVHALPEGPEYFPKNQITDQPERFLASEIIREQVLINTDQEVPYASTVVIERWEEEPKLTRIAAAIFCERDGQKGILIGKGGTKLKEIGTGARLQIERMLNKKVFLELFVKVQPEWRNSRHFVEEIDWRRQLEGLIGPSK